MVSASVREYARVGRHAVSSVSRSGSPALCGPRDDSAFGAAEPGAVAVTVALVPESSIRSRALPEASAISLARSMVLAISALRDEALREKAPHIRFAQRLGVRLEFLHVDVARDRRRLALRAGRRPCRPGLLRPPLAPPRADRGRRARSRDRRGSPAGARGRAARPPERASMRPSLKKHAAAPAGSETMLWRCPVGAPQPIGGDEHNVNGSRAAVPLRIGGG